MHGPAITPRVARLALFPFKSLDGVEVEAAELTDRGGLRLDRAFAFIGSDGRVINAKSESRLHELRVAYDAALRCATFTDRASGRQFAFSLDAEGAELARWVGGVLGREVVVRRDDSGGFPDDHRAPGPTIVSSATLATVAAWFDKLDADSLRRRLRTNIEIDDVPPFWEDSLFGAAGDVRLFRVGEIVLEATNPCQRCIVPSRDPDTGRPLTAFAKRVAERRSATLPAWAERSRFDHFYRLAVNTRIAANPAGSALRVGQTVRQHLASADLPPRR